MSTSFQDRTKAPNQATDFNPGNQLPGRPVIVQQQSQKPKQSPSPEQIVRMKQLDAGVMRTLNLQAQRAISTSENFHSPATDQTAIQETKSKPVAATVPGAMGLVVQRQGQESQPTVKKEPDRMQQLDAGMWRALGLQAKLSIGESRDQYEQEADQVAAQVVKQNGGTVHYRSTNHLDGQAIQAEGREVVEGSSQESSSSEGQLVTEQPNASDTRTISKAKFMGLLKGRVQQVANEILASRGQTSEHCPYIHKWFAYYDGKDAEHIEAAVKRYSPETKGAEHWEELIEGVATTVEKAFKRHVSEGTLEGVPEEIRTEEITAEELNITAAAEQGSQVVQRCGCLGSSSSKEKQTLLPREQRQHQQSTFPSLIVMDQEALETGKDVTLDRQEWSSYGAPLEGNYPVWYKKEGKKITVVALKGDNSRLPKGTIVAKSELERSKKEINGHKAFTSFDSDPPFAGLGSKAIEIFKTEFDEEDPRPDGPIAGAYHAYQKMGILALKKPNSDEDYEGMENVKKIVKEVKKFKESQKYNLEDPQTRNALSNYQKQIVEEERKGILKNLFKVEHLD